MATQIQATPVVTGRYAREILEELKTKQTPEAKEFAEKSRRFFEQIRDGHGLTWDEIEKLEPDNKPLSEEEKRQLTSPREYITGEEAKREFGLQVDLP